MASLGFKSRAYMAPQMMMDSSCASFGAPAGTDSTNGMEWVAPEPPKVETDTLEVIVSFQSFNGSFRWEELFVKTLGLDFAKAKEGTEH